MSATALMWTPASSQPTAAECLHADTLDTRGVGSAGGAGSLISGLFSEGGKIASGAVNVLSSFMVGNLTGGTTGDPYGQTCHPQQRGSVTAPVRNTNNTFCGHNVPDVMQALDDRDARRQQSFLANQG